MPGKKDKRLILSCEQSFCLDLNSNWSLLFRTQFLLFYWLHKTLCLCSQSKQDSYCKIWSRTCFGGVPGFQRGLRAGQDQLPWPPHPQSHSTKNLSVLTKLALIQTPEYWVQGWDQREVCSASRAAAEWPHYLHSAQPALEQGGVALIACRRCLKSRSEGELW